MTAVLAVGAASVMAGTSASAVGTVHVWATNVNVRADPSMGSRVITRVQPGDYAAICQKVAQEVSQEGYRNDYWTYLTNQGGWVSDIYISGGNNDGTVPGVNTCAPPLGRKPL